MIKKIIAGAAIALTALIATPMAAQAAPGDTYVSSSNIVVEDSTPAPGDTVTVAFKDGAFNDGEDVRFSVTGEGGATLAIIKAAIETASIVKTANANGGVSVDVTLPTDARGTYTITATGLTSGTIGTAALTVVAADSAAGSVALPVTGTEVPVALLWIAGGAVALGLMLLVVVAVRRRSLSSN
ncbi:MAG: Sortase sorted surface protein [Homoserinimonas sp.]|jgi:hypothetical protein|nr:Sortase sorted surface protein [Homoserinimonas sp.]